MQNPEVLIRRTLGNKEGEAWKEAGVDRTGGKAVVWLETEGDSSFTRERIEVDLATGAVEHTYYKESLGWEDRETKLEEKSFALKLLSEVKGLIMDGEDQDKQKGEEVISLIQEKVEAYYAFKKFLTSLPQGRI